MLSHSWKWENHWGNTVETEQKNKKLTVNIIQRIVLNKRLHATLRKCVTSFMTALCGCTSRVDVCVWGQGHVAVCVWHGRLDLKPCWFKMNWLAKLKCSLILGRYNRSRIRAGATVGGGCSEVILSARCPSADQRAIL